MMRHGIYYIMFLFLCVELVLYTFANHDCFHITAVIAFCMGLLASGWFTARKFEKSVKTVTQIDSIFEELGTAIKDHDKRFSNLLDLVNNLSGISMWIKDREDRYVFIDATCKDLLFADFEYSDIIGKTDQEIITKEPLDLSELEEVLSKTAPERYPDLELALFSDKLVCNITDLITRVLGRPCRFYEEVGDLSLEVWKTPIYDTDGDLSSTVGCLVDVTERRALWKAHLKKAEVKGDVFKIDSTKHYYIKKYDFNSLEMHEC